ncbi:NAD(P)-dependent alcohol dehydrogenase [Rhodoplanes sp. SY1]|uniref:NAD(P)-dependent alcohol dehydrogenase n=1 Tax=Rhodoplanes sp. SY1 TaxID=3166646 RepID=UPI0038B66CD2
MCETCKNESQHLSAHGAARRNLVKAGVGFAAGAASVGLAGSADAQTLQGDDRTGPRSVDGFGVQQPGGPVQRVGFQRRSVGPKDVAIEILYCGLCHSDIHTVKGEWGPIQTPCVPGHEIVGRVIGVGRDVTRFKIGDIAGVGCMVDSCGTCENCIADLEQYCLKGSTLTYQSKADVPGGYTQGGWSQGIVVTEHFVVRMPQTGNHAGRAPLLCAGITTFSPLRHWRVEPGMRVGIIGIGGLGHMGVKLAAAERADVTAFTTSPSKIADARRFGARDAVLSTDEKAMASHAGSYDLLISTIPKSFDASPFLLLLGLNGTLVSVGTPFELEKVTGGGLWRRRRSISASIIGGMAETQEVVDYCAARNITADIELIRPDQINEAMNRVVGKEARYRFVIDMKAA